MPSSPVLSVVIPVYNEEANLTELLQDWGQVFRATGLPYRVMLIDDGSRDNSLQLLLSLAKSDPTLEVHTQQNAGHGPAILKGYRLSLDAKWVFQIDSDHQLETAAFAELWANRENYDLLIAQRVEKNATAGRRRVSAASRGLVRLLFGDEVADVNSPYRLMRSQRLREAMEKVPGDSFAPNILLTAWFIRKKSRIFTTTAAARKAGVLRRSRLSRHIFFGAWKSAFQTLLFRIR